MLRPIAPVALFALVVTVAPTPAHAQPPITAPLYRFDFALPADFIASVRAPYVDASDAATAAPPRFALLVEDPRNVRHETDVALSFLAGGALLQTVGGLQCSAVVSCRYEMFVTPAVLDAFRADPFAVSVRLAGTTTLQGEAPLAFDLTRFGVAAASSVVPEPGTWTLLGTGLAALGAVARRRRRAPRA